MNGIWKKIAALVLVMCLVISVLPPVALAADTAVSYTYDFSRGPSAYIANNTKLNTIADYAQSNNGLWKFAGEWTTGGAVSIVSSAVTAARLNYGSKKVPENFYAFYVNVPENGTYDLSITYTSGNYDTTSGVYLIPASAVTADGALNKDAVKSELTNTTNSAYYVGSVVDVKGTVTNGTSTALEAKDLTAGEYVLAFNYLAGTNYYLYLRNLTLTKQEEEVPEESVPEASTPEETTPEEEPGETVSYDYNFIRGASAFIPNNTSISTITEYSMSENSRWKYAGMWASTVAPVQLSTTKAVSMNFGSAKKAENYIALYINVPEAGEYDLSAAIRAGRYDTTSGVYIFPAADVTASGAFSADALKAELSKTTNSAYFVGSIVDTGTEGNAGYSDDADAGTTMKLGKVEFAAAGEYVVAFNYLSGESYRLALKSITLTKKAQPVVPEAKPTIDFTEVEEIYGQSMTSSSSGAGKTLTDLYNAGTINWRFWFLKNYQASVMGGGSNAWSGLRFAIKSGGGYVAYQIKTAEAGNYNVTVHFETRTGYAENVQVYLLPKNTASTNFDANLAAATPIGSYNCKSDSSEHVAVKQAMDIPVVLEANTQYAIVFCITDNTSTQYATINGITLTRNNVFAAGDSTYGTLEEAAAAGEAVTLTDDAAIGEVVLPEGVTLDLAGKTLYAAALTGKVVDSSDGNNGLIATANGNVVFSENNADLPLYDGKAAGYRLFDYTMDNYTIRPVGEASQKFWYKFHFRTSDAADAAVDQDAYALVKGGYTGFQISAEMTWAGNALDTVYFGRNYEGLETNTEKMDAFSKEWATYDGEANDGRWLFVTVRGLGEGMVGELTVKPVITANNVVIAGETMSYTAAG